MRKTKNNKKNKKIVGHFRVHLWFPSQFMIMWYCDKFLGKKTNTLAPDYSNAYLITYFTDIKWI